MILDTLKKLYDTRGDEVEAWLGQQRTTASPFFTTSVDLRHSGLRIAPVDTNLFPAGFQNLSPAGRARATRFIARYLSESYPDAKRVLIIPESHTRNLPYLDNLASLVSFFEAAGVEVKIGSLVAIEETTLTSALGKEVKQYPLVRNNNIITLKDGFTPDLIIINNDMTAGIPDILQKLLQPMVPAPHMGWFQRHKSVHFAHYQKLATNFGETFGIDPCF